MASVQDVAKRLASIRKEKGLSAENFARVISQAGFECSSGTVGGIERGRVGSIDALYLLAVSRACGVSVMELLGEASPARSAELPALDPMLERFARVLRDLPATEVESHLRALELLAQDRKATVRPPGKKKTAA